MSVPPDRQDKKQTSTSPRYGMNLQLRTLAPISVEGIIPQVVAEDTVKLVVKTIAEKCGKHYIVCLEDFVNSIDLDMDWSRTEFRNMSCVVNGNLTPEFVRGVKVLRKYFSDVRQSGGLSDEAGEWEKP